MSEVNEQCHVGFTANNKVTNICYPSRTTFAQLSKLTKHYVVWQPVTLKRTKKCYELDRTKAKLECKGL